MGSDVSSGVITDDSERLRPNNLEDGYVELQKGAALVRINRMGTLQRVKFDIIWTAHRDVFPN